MATVAPLSPTLRPECAPWCEGDHAGSCCVLLAGAVALTEREHPVKVQLYRNRQLGGTGWNWVSMPRTPERITPAEAAELGAALLRAAAIAEDPDAAMVLTMPALAEAAA